jgi:adenylate cyclase class 2
VSKNLEHELKFRVRSLDGIRELLESLGAEPVGTWFEHDTYFSDAWGITRSGVHGRYLRMRRMFQSTAKAKAILGFHEVLCPSQTMELESEVGDPQQVSVILEKLGWKSDVVVRKWRSAYRIARTHVFLDWVESLGDFVEVEAETEREMKDICRTLGLSLDKSVRQGYPDMMRNTCPGTGSQCSSHH